MHHNMWECTCLTLHLSHALMFISKFCNPKKHLMQSMTYVHFKLLESMQTIHMDSKMQHHVKNCRKLAINTSL